MRYYINDNTGTIARVTESCAVYVLRNGESKWEKLPRDNSYIREILGGQGNNCLTALADEVAQALIAERIKE